MLSLFVPCYNEERCLEDNTKKILAVLRDYKKQDPKFSFEINIVNDCSKDRTKEIADKLSKDFKEIRAIHYEGVKPTRRENLIRSFALAKGDILAFTDADLSTDIIDLPKLYSMVTKKNVVIGDRYNESSNAKRSTKRYFISKFFNYLTKSLFFDFTMGSRDHFCGFKAFHKDTINHIVQYTGVGNKMRSMFWDAEMLVYANRLGYSIDVIPVRWQEMRWSKLNIPRESKIFLYMFKLWWKLKWTKLTKNGFKAD
ncbi:MAG: glycosyltransferase [Candidatus Nanoarchaeia archaeon]|nr:glycosyltransferase [Candidatus Nanoarchaeia archaeon]MDD5587593.1 glycosyltransferase [Candidatus Nanoarchaeia archaeon]